ncbi:MAG: VCBS repeat-containing protein [Alcanivoracaceae bacterium]|nr:VCBS repeat-containing protein [Alcanivoracaceae bacterium]
MSEQDVRLVKSLTFPGRLFPLGGGESARLRQPVVVADMNSDGVPDIVTLMHDDNKDGDYRSPDYLSKVSVYDVNILFGSKIFPGTFSSPKTVAQVDSPTAFVVKDMNGDGIPDIIVAREYATVRSPGPGQNSEENWNKHFRSYQSEIIILKAKLSKELKLPTKERYALKGRVASVKIGDLNGNGKLDIAVLGVDSANYSQSVSNSLKSYVGILFAVHSQKGKFKPLKKVFAGDYASSFAVGDLNNDAIDDIALTFTSPQTLKPQGNKLKVLFAQKGKSSFVEGEMISSMHISSMVTQVRIHDMNHDGYNDLIITGSSEMVGHAVFASTEIYVWLNNPDSLGSFLAPVSIDEKSNGKSILSSFEIADINGDNYADVVVSAATEQYEGGVIRYYLADENNLGHYLPPQDVAGEQYQSRRGRRVGSLTDMTGDGIVDITTVIADYDMAYVSIFEGSGNKERRFYAFQDYHVKNAFEEDPSWWNLKGFPDFNVDWGRGVSLNLPLTKNKKEPFEIPYKWEPSGTDTKGKTQHTEWNSIRRLLAKINHLTPKGFQGLMDPEKRYVSFDMGYYPGAVADFNGDGLLDYAEADSKKDDRNTISVWLNDFDNPGVFLPYERYKINGISYTASVKAEDLNSDGFTDIIVEDGIYCSGFAILWADNKNLGEFLEPQYIANDSCIKNVIVKDLNRDGKLDLIAVGIESISIFFANPEHPKSFLEVQSFVVENPRNNELYISVDDLSRDGFVDILVSRGGGNNYMNTVTESSIWVYWSDPNGTKPFKESEFLQLDGVENKDRNIVITVKDLNRDGRKDLIVDGEAPLQLLLSNAGGSFSYMKPAVISQAANFIGVQDVNQDGYADLILKEGMGVGIALANPNVKGSFLPVQVFDVGGDGGSITSLLLTDLNADGKLDMVYNSWSIVTGGLVRVLRAK